MTNYDDRLQYLPVEPTVPIALTSPVAPRSPTTLQTTRAKNHARTHNTEYSPLDIAATNTSFKQPPHILYATNASRTDIDFTMTKSGS